MRRGIYRSIVHVARREVGQLRATLSRRRHFVRVQSAQVGATKALLRGPGLGHLTRSLGSERGWAKLLAALADQAELHAHVEQHGALWRCAGEQVVALEQSLAEQRQSE